MLFYVPVKADQFVLHKLAVLRGGGLFFFAQQMVHRDVEIPGDLCQLIRRQAFDAPRLVIGKRRARPAWLPYTDATAHEALKNPVFRLKLILQSYKEAAPVQAQSGSSDITFAPEPETEDKAITLEIAPAGEAGYSRFYYGRVNTTPNYFILNMDAVRLLGASLSEDN